MSAEILAALIVAIGGIVAAFVQRARRKPRAVLPAAGVVIVEPREGAVLEVPASSPRPHRRSISGRVVGMNSSDLKRGGLHVEVVIRTDALYPQGRAVVMGNGQWHLPEASFGGYRHDIEAILIDSAGREIARAHGHAFVRRV